MMNEQKGLTVRTWRENNFLTKITESTEGKGCRLRIKPRYMRKRDKEMVIATDSAIELVKRYIEELRKNGVEVSEAIVFGSYTRGTAKE